MSGDTPRRTVRIEDGLWDAAKAEFKARGTNISDEIRGFLREEVERGFVDPISAYYEGGE